MDTNGEMNDGGAEGLPVSPYLMGRCRRFLNGKGKGANAWTLEDVEAAFFEGVEAKADQLGVRKLAKDLAATRATERDAPSMMVLNPVLSLPPFESALMRMADAERSDEWSYNPENLESDSGVIVLAILYDKPKLEVARAVAETRRRWVQDWLANAG